MQIAADGEVYTTEALMFTFYLTAGMVSSVWPLGGPTAGGTHLTVRGAGFNNFDGLAVVLGSGPPLRTWLLSSTAMVATSSNASSAWLSPSSASPAAATRSAAAVGGRRQPRVRHLVTVRVRVRARVLGLGLGF